MVYLLFAPSDIHLTLLLSAFFIFYFFIHWSTSQVEIFSTFFSASVDEAHAGDPVCSLFDSPWQAQEAVSLVNVHLLSICECREPHSCECQCSYAVSHRFVRTEISHAF